MVTFMLFRMVTFGTSKNFASLQFKATPCGFSTPKIIDLKVIFPIRRLVTERSTPLSLTQDWDYIALVACPAPVNTSPTPFAELQQASELISMFENAEGAKEGVGGGGVEERVFKPGCRAGNQSLTSYVREPCLNGVSAILLATSQRLVKLIL